MPDIKLQGYKYRQKKPQDIHQVNSKKTMVSLILLSSPNKSGSYNTSG